MIAVFQIFSDPKVRAIGWKRVGVKNPLRKHVPGLSSFTQKGFQRNEQQNNSVYQNIWDQ